MKKKNGTPSKVAIVTGAAQGIGAAIATSLAESGFAVAALDIKLQDAKKLAARLRRRGFNVRPFQCDVALANPVHEVIATVEKEMGPVHVLVNNAGVGGPFHRVDEVSDVEWEWVFSTNVKSVLNFCRVLLPKMKRRAYGRVVNIASIQGLLGAARSSTYVASKHAVVGYTRAIAAEWGPHGITCNAVCPGYVDTRMGIQNNAISRHQKRVVLRTPVRRVATPMEIAHLVRTLVMPNAGYVNGSVIVMDGGISADVGVS